MATMRSQIVLKRNLADDQKAVSSSTQPTRQRAQRTRLHFFTVRLAPVIWSDPSLRTGATGKPRPHDRSDRGGQSYRLASEPTGLEGTPQFGRDGQRPLSPRAGSVASFSPEKEGQRCPSTEGRRRARAPLKTGGEGD